MKRRRGYPPRTERPLPVHRGDGLALLHELDCPAPAKACTCCDLDRLAAAEALEHDDDGSCCADDPPP